jgi:hypothetical protein
MEFLLMHDRHRVRRIENLLQLGNPDDLQYPHGAYKEKLHEKD